MYSVSGELVRQLLNETPRVLSGGLVAEQWDGRDDGGAVVPGGVYIIAVSGGVAVGDANTTATVSLAVVR